MSSYAYPTDASSGLLKVPCHCLAFPCLSLTRPASLADPRHADLLRAYLRPTSLADPLPPTLRCAMRYHASLALLNLAMSCRALPALPCVAVPCLASTYLASLASPFSALPVRVAPSLACVALLIPCRSALCDVQPCDNNCFIDYAHFSL